MGARDRSRNEESTNKGAKHKSNYFECLLPHDP